MQTSRFQPVPQELSRTSRVLQPFLCQMYNIHSRNAANDSRVFQDPLFWCSNSTTSRAPKPSTLKEQQSKLKNDRIKEQDFRENLQRHIRAYDLSRATLSGNHSKLSDDNPRATKNSANDHSLPMYLPGNHSKLSNDNPKVTKSSTDDHDLPMYLEDYSKKLEKRNQKKSRSLKLPWNFPSIRDYLDEPEAIILAAGAMLKQLRSFPDWVRFIREDYTHPRVLSKQMKHISEYIRTANPYQPAGMVVKITKVLFGEAYLADHILHLLDEAGFEIPRKKTRNRRSDWPKEDIKLLREIIMIPYPIIEDGCLPWKIMVREPINKCGQGLKRTGSKRKKNDDDDNSDDNDDE
ncbi:uncharacterized protein LOC141855120 [Brevipalpus obovatus]|uniref:uncharacterized protein LOC141855120 n=1 Tax=Brevipalpus obovatus TaxID=246614 RepID=UPI003D9ED62B